MMANWDAIIIGAGMSGLCVGALLANAGKKVLVLEKEKWTDGRARAGIYKGHVLENGPHGPSAAGYLEDIFSRVGKPYPGVTHDLRTEVYHEGKWRPIMELVDRKQLRKIIDEIAASSYEELKIYDDMPIKEWVSRRTDNEGIHFLFWILSLGVVVANRYETIAAGEMLLFLKEHIDRWGNIRNTGALIVGGTPKLTETLVDVIKEKGSEVRTNTKVNDIVIENGRVLGVEIEVGERVIPSQILDTEVINAPVVVSTVPLWDLFKIVSEDAFPAWYVDWIKRIRYKFSHVSSFMIGVDEPLWPENIMRWYLPALPRSGMAMASVFMSSPIQEGAIGKSEGWFYFQSHWDEMPSLFELDQAKIRRQVRRLLDLFEEDVKDLFPDLEKHCLWGIRQAAVFRVAQAPGLVGECCPDMHPPGVQNLYLVSDTIRTSRGMGYQAVAHSALLCADEILEGK